MDKDGDL
jgi:hypothetical protein